MNIIFNIVISIFISFSFLFIIFYILSLFLFIYIYILFIMFHCFFVEIRSSGVSIDKVDESETSFSRGHNGTAAR